MVGPCAKHAIGAKMFSCKQQNHKWPLATQLSVHGCRLSTHSTSLSSISANSCHLSRQTKPVDTTRAGRLSWVMETIIGGNLRQIKSRFPEQICVGLCWSRSTLNLFHLFVGLCVIEAPLHLYRFHNLGPVARLRGIHTASPSWRASSRSSDPSTGAVKHSTP